MRQFTPLDHLVINLDQGLRTVLGRPLVTGRANPAQDIAEADLSDKEKKLSASLMRVNHAGEISAQALYQGQSLTARQSAVAEKMQHAAAEENDHLDWCEKRVNELGENTSLLAPFWYAGSFVIGGIAGAAGDKWSLGFVAETEHQVIKHLDSHLERLPANDLKSRAIVKQMRIDEKQHATMALHSGGAPLPKPVKFMMRQVSKIMTTLAARF